jgi:hypothetical protein
MSPTQPPHWHKALDAADTNIAGDLAHSQAIYDCLTAIVLINNAKAAQRLVTTSTPTATKGVMSHSATGP